MPPELSDAEGILGRKLPPSFTVRRHLPLLASAAVPLPGQGAPALRPFRRAQAARRRPAAPSAWVVRGPPRTGRYVRTVTQEER